MNRAENNTSGGCLANYSSALKDQALIRQCPGDHEQLRPKAEQYELTVESRRGYDLDRSLFERLQRQGFPVATLAAQRRMRPAISALIRAPVYPELQVTQLMFLSACHQALRTRVLPHLGLVCLACLQGGS